MKYVFWCRSPLDITNNAWKVLNQMDLESALITSIQKYYNRIIHAAMHEFIFFVDKYSVLNINK